MDKLSVNSSYTLNTDSRIPAIGFGTRGKLASGTTYKAVRSALREGYRHIDTAYAYGCEHEVGEAIRDSRIPREEIWVTTKLDNQWHHQVDKAVELSLTALGLEYIDLYLMHWPCPLDPDDSSKPLYDWHFAKTWELMQRIPQRLVRNIGVANFDIHNLKILLQCPTTSTIPAANQIEIHPYWPCNELVSFCCAAGIHCIAYSPLGSRQSLLTDDSILQSIAASEKKTVQQVLLQWGIQRGYSVIPGSTHDMHIRSNFNIDRQPLTEDELASISAISRRHQVYDDVKRMSFPVRVFHDTDNFAVPSRLHKETPVRCGPSLPPTSKDDTAIFIGRP